MSWDGIDRRENKVDNKNDLIVEIHSDLRHLVKTYDKHVEDDNKQFDSINTKLEFQQKIVYCGMGIFAFVGAMIGVLLRFVK